MAFERIFILVLIFIIGSAWLFLFSYKRVGRVIGTIGTIVIFAVAIGYCLIMANRYQSYNLDCVSTDKENILHEMPSLEFSEDEMSIFNGILETPFAATYMKEGWQRIPEEEIREFLNGILPSDATSVSATLYDDHAIKNLQGDFLLRITYITDELEIYVECYDTGSVTKVINKHSEKTIYENENNEHFGKYIQRRNWFAWMQ